MFLFVTPLKRQVLGKLMALGVQHSAQAASVDGCLPRPQHYDTT